jgi:HAD superfamily hydrolase (TIGR01509 family)
MPLEALIFDVDGTLAETEELHRRAFNETFEAFGLDWVWTPDLYRILLRVTGGKERIRYYVEGWCPHGGEKALAQVAEIHASKTASYSTFVEAGLAEPRPGILQLIDEAHSEGIALAIATTTALGNVTALLRTSFGAERAFWFSAIAAGDMVEQKKPAPDIYNVVLEQLGLQASVCIAFEDSENGVAAARDVGLAVIATPSFYTKDDDFCRATSVISDLGEAKRSFRHIAGRRIGAGRIDIGSLRGILEENQSLSHLARDYEIF